MVSHLCVFLDDLLDRYFGQSICHIGCIDGASRLCGFSHDVLDRYFGQNIDHIDCVEVVYPQCVLRPALLLQDDILQQ